MSNMLELIKELEEKNIKISLKEGNLQINFDGEMDKEILTKLKLNKEELIHFLSKKSGVITDIKNVKLLESYPISHAQKRLWIQSQNEKNSKAYHINNKVDLKGAYDINILEKAIFEVIRRHEILRTVFKLNDQLEIKQWILRYDEFKFQVNHFDLKHENQPLDTLEKYIEKDNDMAFDLEKGPLLRVSFFQFSDSHYILYYSMHHIVTDGWSMNILERDLLAFYEAIKSGSSHKLPNLRIQYKDYASWQISAIQEGLYKDHKQFWIEHLSGELPKLDFPSFKTRPKLMTYNSQAMQTFLPLELTSRFKLLCNENNGSLFMGILTAIKILLSRHTGQQDIILGTAVAGREDSDLEEQIGFYVNTLALRNKIDPNDSFLTFFEKVKKSTLSAFSHQIYPFNLLVEDLNLKRDAGRHPIFDMLFSFNNTVSNDSLLGEIDDENINDLGFTTCLNDIEFHFQEYGDNLSFQINFNSELYDYSTIKRFMMHFKKMLAELIDRPNQEIKSIDYLSDQERQQLLVEFNDTVLVYPKDKTVIDLFKEQVYKYSGKEAVKDDLNSFTYFEVNKFSDRIAHYIVSVSGEGDKSPVCVLLERSAEMVLVLLAILKSGRSYIPLDPNFPKDRLSYIINNSQSNLIICEGDNELKYTTEIHILPLKSILRGSDEVQEFVPEEISLEDTAYIIYTSGSTGNPKGVQIGHRSLLNFLLSVQQEPGVSSNDTLFSVTTVSFDISVLEIFLPLISGATVYIASQIVLSDPNFIIEKIAKIQPTIIQGTPSFYQMLFNADWQGSKMLKVLCGGDLLSESLAEKLINHSLEVWNMYGPTETTVWSSIKKLEQPKDVFNIGKPIHNTQFYILDAFLHLTPVGTPGALYIAGDGLAKGYHKNDSLTKEKFIQNPFNSTGRLYETGDMGKWNDAGEIVFLGRNDNQVKIRGYRIELGEVENMISQYSDKLQEVAVVARQNELDTFMVAYFVATGAVDKSALRSFIQAKLPDYMVPNFFVELDVLPQTPNGKIDRRSLPNVSADDLIRKEYVAARNDVEQKLVLIWQEILKRENIGVRDDFFELGGHSLKAIELIFMIQKEFDLNLDTYLFFENPTIEFLDNYIHNMNYNDMNIIKENDDDYLIF